MWGLLSTIKSFPRTSPFGGFSLASEMLSQDHAAVDDVGFVACCARRRNCADRSLGNAFTRLHCCRRDMVCWLLCSTKLRVREQPKSSASEMLSQDYIAVGVTWFVACCLRRNCARNAASEMLSQDCVAVSVTWFVACCARRSCARISAQGL